jgi:hypothetical protein
VDELIEGLLPKVKTNLILTHDLDDDLIRGLIRAALDYAKTYQKRRRAWSSLPPTTEQAVIMLATFWYESRDGGTGGFFADTSTAAARVMEVVGQLLQVNKEYWHI